MIKKPYTIHNGNSLDVLKTLEENSIDSIVTDPPYELGFMGKKWDSTGIAYNVELWKECLRVLKPGGYLLAFSGSRTYHRMATAIEDAGFEIKDEIMWVYGTGFPKSLNIGKAIDKLQGNKREIVGKSRIGKTSLGDNSGWNTTENMRKLKQTGLISVTKGTSIWEGWGTALKPSHEPICMAQKPKEIDNENDNLKLFNKIFYCGKASKKDRNEGCNYIEAKKYSHDGRNKPIENAFQRNNSESHNYHPTVKPTELMIYLCKMVTPPNGIILDPFMGSGSTGKAAIIENFNFIGIELESEYCNIAELRIKCKMINKEKIISKKEPNIKSKPLW